MWGEENGKGKEEMGNLLGNPILLHYYYKFRDQTPIHSR